MPSWNPKAGADMIRALSLILLGVFTVHGTFAASNKPVWTTYESAKAEDPDFMVQGEYGSGKDKKGVQVVALGAGKFDAYFLDGGLPGDGWKKGDPRVKIHGKTQDGVTTFEKNDLKAEIKDGKITVTKGEDSYTLSRVERESATLGKKAPEGAIVLFDGSNADAWKNGKMKDGLLLHGTTSKETFQSYQLHLEFMTPYRQFDRGQGRGNSGVYHQGRYETQVLDSFGLDGRWNETGGIYKVAEPKVNMCFPPLRWQTYDVELTSAEFKDGVMTKKASITVKLNGVLVHENQELGPRTTAAPVKEGPGPGPIYLQNHGNPVFYRNIWIVKK